MAKAAAFETICEFLVAQKTESTNVTFRYIDLARLVSRIVDTDNEGGQSVYHLRRKISSFVLAQGDNAGGDDKVRHASMLRLVLNKFCDLELTTEDIAKAFSSSTRPPKTRRGAASSSYAVAVVPAPAVPDDGNALRGRFEQLGELSELDLKLAVVSSEKQVAAHAETLRKLRVDARKQEKKMESLEPQVAEAQHEANVLRSLVEFRKGPAKHCTNYGGYVLAIKSTRGYASSRATTAMIAGESFQGNLKDHHTVTRFEHRLSVAKAVRAQEFNQEAADACDIFFVEHASDSTHHYAVEKSKVWMNMVETTCCNLQQLVDSVAVDAAPCTLR